jgi:hypothetical protein
MKRLALVCLLGCGGGQMTVQDGISVGIETAQQEQCVDRFKPDAGAIDGCRSSVRATWDAYWLAHFADGGSR